MHRQAQGRDAVQVIWPPQVNSDQGGQVLALAQRRRDQHQGS
jgi:hypothetical protein